MFGLLQNETATPTETVGLSPIISVVAVAILVVAFVLVARRM